jgi:hypothetical protein
MQFFKRDTLVINEIRGDGTIQVNDLVLKKAGQGNPVGELSLRRTEHSEHDTAAMSSFVDFSEASFRAGANEARRPREEANLLGSVLYRPMVFRRNDVRWIAACAWRSAAKADDIAALKRAKRELDPALIGQVADSVATLIRQLYGGRFAEAITTVPCSHSRRLDCFGKRLAQAVGRSLGIPFLQVFADLPCSGVSHPKEFRKLAPLQQIADPVSSMILVDDLATSGWHVEKSVTALHSLGASTSAFVWIGVTVT